jgi:hypothetical protein
MRRRRFNNDVGLVRELGEKGTALYSPESLVVVGYSTKRTRLSHIRCQRMTAGEINISN